MGKSIRIAFGMAALCAVGAVGGCNREEPKPTGERTTLSIAQSEDLSKKALSILNEKCTVCHGAERFEARHFSAEEWGRVIDSMMAKGAKLSGEEADVLRHWRAAK